MTVNIFPISPGRVSWSSTKKQSWDVTEFVSASGERKSLIQQKYPKWEFSVDFPILCDRDVDDLMGFYAQCKGSWKPFYYKAYNDCYVADKALTKLSSGAYQAVIVSGGYEEPATLVDNVFVFVNGKRFTDFTVSGGLITVNTTSTNIRFDYEYYWKVTFESSISVKQCFKDFNKVSLKLKVAR